MKIIGILSSRKGIFDTATPLLPEISTGITNVRGILSGTLGGTYANYCTFKQKVAANTAGGIMVSYNGGDAQSAMIGLDLSSTDNKGYPGPGWTAGALISSGVLYSVEAGALTERGLTMNIGDRYRIYRYTDGKIKLERSGVLSGWEPIYTFSITSTADLFPKTNIHSTNKLYYPSGYNCTYKTPFTLVGSIIVGDGNSKTVGTGSTTPSTDNYLTQLSAITEIAALGATFTNKGVNSQSTQQMIADSITDVDVLINTTKFNILILQEIENDIYTNGLSPESAVAHMINHIENEKRAGWDKILLKTLSYRDNLSSPTPGGDTQAQYAQKLVDVNTLIAASWESWGVDKLVDLRANVNFQLYNTTYYNVDHIHYNTAGYGLDALITSSALLSLN